MYTSLIACCAYTRMPALARSLLSDMRERGLPPSLHTYNARIKLEAHCGSGLDVAVALVQVCALQGSRCCSWGFLALFWTSTLGCKSAIAARGWMARCSWCRCAPMWKVSRKATPLGISLASSARSMQ